MLGFLGDVPGGHFGLCRAVRLEFPNYGRLAKFRTTIAERQRTAEARSEESRDRSGLDGSSASSSPIYEVPTKPTSPVYSPGVPSPSYGSPLVSSSPRRPPEAEAARSEEGPAEDKATGIKELGPEDSEEILGFCPSMLRRSFTPERSPSSSMPSLTDSSATDTSTSTSSGVSSGGSKPGKS